ncbi:hypothetical protein E4U52_004009 [Claviceps spartinae]|nr:hypothetical protein E4U52_004009 [Claviceps spartinae]
MVPRLPSTNYQATSTTLQFQSPDVFPHAVLRTFGERRQYPARQTQENYAPRPVVVNFVRQRPRRSRWGRRGGYDAGGGGGGSGWGGGGDGGGCGDGGGGGDGDGGGGGGD